MNWLVQTLRQYPELAVFLVVALGALIGKIKLGSASLGTVTGALFAGLLVGQLNIPVAGAAKAILYVYQGNVFPEMNITWGTYANNLGHTDFPGCFRCHDGNHKAKDGKEITQDCNACHSLLAMDEPDPKILHELAGGN